MHSQPLVTIFMPTYNRKHLLERAVESVLRQTYRNIELIIVDDCSKDDTLSYLCSLQYKDARVKFFQNGSNSGACISRNRAISEAGGFFITGLDDDDYFLENHIENFVRCWQVRGKKVVALYSNVFRKFNYELKKAYPKINSCRAEDLIYANWPGNQLFTETSLLRAISGFNVDIPAWQDLDCWYRLLKFTDGIASCASSYTYVLDISHPHERISNKKSEKILLAWSIFCCSNELTSRQSDISKLQLMHFFHVGLSIKTILHKLIGMPRWHNFRHMLIIFYLSRATNRSR